MVICASNGNSAIAAIGLLDALQVVTSEPEPEPEPVPEPEAKPLAEKLQDKNLFVLRK